MPDDFFTFKAEGIEKLAAAMKRLPREIQLHLAQAGKEASDEILREEGLRRYPPRTKANQPPAPYYVRGRGTQYVSYLKPTSENLGKKWVRKVEGSSIRIGNVASYAKWVHGKDDQAQAMADIGWKKLFDVAKDKMPRIKRIYQGWINEAIRKLNL